MLWQVLAVRKSSLCQSQHVQHPYITQGNPRSKPRQLDVPLRINTSLGRVNQGHNNPCSCGMNPDRALKGPVGTKLVI